MRETTAAGAEPSRARDNVVALFRKPTPQDAFELGRATFVANERVDMQALTARLGVARTTLHRWVGTRESLLDRILGDLASEFWELAPKLTARARSSSSTP
jgi:hypothetical protein